MTTLSISPGQIYPKQGQNGIVITSMDNFNAQAITVIKQQLGKY
ncbi:MULTISPECIES: hypothetical protein [Bacillus]|nr:MULTISPECIES: hypothetical protein [Bacillus]